VLLLLLMAPHLAMADGVVDQRLQVELQAADYDVAPEWLHQHIQQAAAMALTVVWQRLLPADAVENIPPETDAIQFLQTAKPTDSGMIITFQKQRIFDYLAANHLQTIDEAAASSTPLVVQDETTLLLTVHRHASLAEQVLLEHDLTADARVAAVIPYLLSRDQQQYRLHLYGEDSTWLVAWFGSRGMTLEATPDGWDAHE